MNEPFAQTPKPGFHAHSVLRAYRGRGLFITGTGTDIGKTTVTAALAGAFFLLGLRVGICKPVASGCPKRPDRNDPESYSGDDLLSPDVEIAARCAGLGSIDEMLLRAMSPLRYAAPVSPHLAARLEQRPPDWRHVAAALDYWEQSCDVLLVEGAGGWMVPLDEDYFTIADLAGILGLPVLVVTDPQLGTLNDTQLTVSAIRQRGLAIAGMVINRVPAAKDLAVESNIVELPRFCGVPLVATLPEIRGLPLAAIPDEFIAAMGAFARQWWGRGGAPGE